MRNLFATTALVALMTAPVFAQSGTETKTAQETAATQDQTDRGGILVITIPTLDLAENRGYLASNLIGKWVYTGAGDEAENVGEIDDFLVGEDGSVKAAIIGVGGFLGIGEKDVAIEFGRLTMQQTGENSVRVVTDVTAEEFEQAAAYERPEGAGGWEMWSEAERNAPRQDQTAMRATEQSGEQADSQTSPFDDPRDPAIRDTFVAGKTLVKATELSADQIIGATVYDANYKDIGEISDVIMDADGKAEAAIVDVGGFLGLGEKPVAVSFDQVEFMKDEGGSLFISTPYSEERLDDAVAYDADAWTDKRDDMMLRPVQ